MIDSVFIKKCKEAEERAEAAEKKLAEYLANHDKTICVWCKTVGPKDAKFMWEHAQVCENNPLGVMMKLYEKIQAMWLIHSLPVMEGNRKPSDAVGSALLELFPPLDDLAEAVKKKNTAPPTGTSMYDGEGHLLSDEEDAEVWRRRREHAAVVADDIAKHLGG